MATINLWPDVLRSAEKPSGPTQLLKDQAEFLSEKTQSVVQAYVLSEVDERKPSEFVDRFILRSPSLNYRYPLFSVRYGARSFPQLIEWDSYEARPFAISADEEELREGVKQVWDEQELQHELRRIFSFPDTVEIIQNLIARANL